MDLAALADFNAVATHGGFGPAGRALERPKATLSRHVAELEEALGVRLIERGSRRLHLTEEGLALHESTRELMADLQEAGAAVASRAPVARGRLRISAPVVFAHVVLGQIATRFALAYPQVMLEIVADDRITDPVEDGFDLVIRINPARDEQLVGRRILGDERWIVAAPVVPMPSMPSTMAHAQPPLEVPAVVSTAASLDTVWHIRSKTDEPWTIKPAAVLKLSSLLMIREAVLAGIGVARLPKLLVQPDVQSGRLVCWGAEAGPPVEIWALYHSRRLLSVKVRAFLDMLADLST